MMKCKKTTKKFPNNLVETGDLYCPEELPKTGEKVLEDESSIEGETDLLIVLSPAFGRSEIWTTSISVLSTRTKRIRIIKNQKSRKFHLRPPSKNLNSRSEKRPRRQRKSPRRRPRPLRGRGCEGLSPAAEGPNSRFADAGLRSSTARDNKRRKKLKRL